MRHALWTAAIVIGAVATGGCSVEHHEHEDGGGVKRETVVVPERSHDTPKVEVHVDD